MNEIADFRLLVGDSFKSARPVKKLEDICKSGLSFRLFKFFYNALHSPRRGLKFIIDQIRKRTNGKKIKIHFSSYKYSNLSGNYYSPRRPITLYRPTNFRTQSSLISTTTLYHELAHFLMQAVYKGVLPSYRGYRAFNPRIVFSSPHIYITDPGTAWVEGFAYAMEQLDGSSVISHYTFKFWSPSWINKSLKQKLSNMFAIMWLLTEFLYSKNSAEKKDIGRAAKIITVMERAGVQRSFQEFLVDYLHRYPEDKARWARILKKYHIPLTVLNYPNYLERS